jgi:catalase
VDLCLSSTASVFYGALVVAGGTACAQALSQDGAALHFVLETYKHSKLACTLNEVAELLASLGVLAARARLRLEHPHARGDFGRRPHSPGG